MVGAWGFEPQTHTVSIRGPTPRYEHAYHLDYGAAAAKYVDAFMQNVNWEEVNRRAESLPNA
jgi:Iron/manganese superoxide dismutases, C-terminal domain